MENKIQTSEEEEIFNLFGKNMTLKEIIEDKENIMLAIKEYNRPDFYYVCSDELKKDYDFVIFLLNHIKNVTLDANGKIRKFPIINVVTGNPEIDSSLPDNLKNHISSIGEVNNLLQAIISNVVNEENYKKKRKQVFSIASDSIKVLDSGFKLHEYCNEICKLELKLALQRMEDFKIGVQKRYGISLGLGFYYLRCSYNHYDNLLETFAKAFIEKIFLREDLCIERELHKEFYSKEHLMQYGVYNYLLNYVARCDIALFEYLKVRKYLLKDKAEMLVRYAENWDRYVSREKAKRYRLVFEKVREYISDSYFDETSLSELDIMAYVVRELGYPQSIFCYDESGYIMTRDVLRNLNYEYIENQIKNSKIFADRRMYRDIKRIFMETLDLGFKVDNKFTNPTFASARNNLFSNEEPLQKCRIIVHDFRSKQ